MKNLTFSLVAVLSTCSAFGQDPSTDQVLPLGALQETPIVITDQIDERRIPTPASGVVTFSVAGSSPIQYEVDLDSVLIQDGFIRVYERMSDSFPVDFCGIAYVDGTGMGRGPDWLADDRTTLTGAWTVGDDTLIVEYEDDIPNGPDPVAFGGEGVHHRRYVYTLVGRSLRIQVIDLDENLSGLSNYSGFYFGYPSELNNLRPVEMQGTMALPLFAFDGRGGSTWYWSNLLDFNQTGATTWVLDQLPPTGFPATGATTRTFSTNFRYRPNSAGLYEEPVNDTFWVTVSESVRDCFPTTIAASESPYRDFVSRRMVMLFSGFTPRWFFHQLHVAQLEEWGLSDIVGYVFHGWSASPGDVGNENRGPDWFPARLSVNGDDDFGDLIADARDAGVTLGHTMRFSGVHPTSPPQFMNDADYARQADPNSPGNLVIKTDLADGSSLLGTAAQAFHSEREHDLMASTYNVGATFIDSMLAGTPSLAPFGDYVDEVAGSPHGKTLAGAIRQQKGWVDRARELVGGPMLGEGSIANSVTNTEWLWAPYVDSVQRHINTGSGFPEASLIPANSPRAVTAWPVIPEFEVEVMRKLQANHGNGFYNRFFGPVDGPEFVMPNGRPVTPITKPMFDRYRAYEITYAHTPYIQNTSSSTRPDGVVLHPGLVGEYYFMVELSRRYFAADLSGIFYEHAGAMQTFEQIYAATGTTDSFIDPRIQLDYGTLDIYINHGSSAWTRQVDGVTYEIPEDGWVAFDSTDDFLAFSARPAGVATRIDYVFAPGRYEAFDGRGLVNGFGGIVTGAPGDVGLMQIRNFALNRTIHQANQFVNPDGSYSPSIVTVQGPANPVTSVEINLREVSMDDGGWTGAQAIARFSNGAWRDVTTLVNWSSSDTTRATIDKSGAIRGQGIAGNVTISCSSFEGVSAPTVNLTLTSQ